ncbi:MAG: lysylphosphatidylglycerol synthase transmembrane domain-containing protein [Candidatus Cryptobacteroides sp.]
MIRKTDLLKYSLSLALAAVLLFLSFRGVKWGDFLEALKSCRWECIGVAMAAGVAAFWVRALRWRQLMEPIEEGISRKAVFNAVNISYLVNLALPRVGELVRCGVLVRHCRKAGYDRILGTVVLERVWDVLMMFLLVALLAAAMWGRFGQFFIDRMLRPFSDRFNLSLWGFMLILLILCAAAVYALYKFRDRWKPFSAIWRFVTGLWSGAVSCFRMKRAWLFLLQSLVIWGLYWLMSASVLWAVQGMDTAGLGSDVADAVARLSGLGATDALFLMLAGSLSSLVPVPGGFGAFHYIVAMALSSVYGIPFGIGIVFATLSHESQTLTMILCGGCSYVAESVGFVSDSSRK